MQKPKSNPRTTKFAPTPFKDGNSRAQSKGVTVDEFGLDTFRVSISDPLDPSRVGAMAIVWVPAPEVLDSMPTDPMLYFRSTYLGTARPDGEKCERVFEKRVVAGLRQSSQIPEPTVLESYRVAREEGHDVFVGMKRRDWYSESNSNQFFDRLAATLRFVEP